ncbi:cupin domain-containing protein [Agriterribacter sp.]|uniref:cupin domain-containing protein n=1 Tax=Agriterribacter sp. TaxID=2821509 RepID=UPI002D0A00DD|nr:cupin domain-containing protein [Agriterribacter sp.]HTN06985.1 cupin domain-containing protein [Agriterribacter sp.]
MSNTIISNSRTGQVIRFIQTAKDANGALLEMESGLGPKSKEPPAHYHPYQEEDFTVISGELTVKIDEQTVTLKKGDTLHIPPGKIHSMWNRSEDTTVVNWKVRPALESETLLETFAVMANNNQTNEDGIPGILQIAVTATRFSKEFRLAKPPYIIQRIVFGMLAPISFIMGYKAVHKVHHY